MDGLLVLLRLIHVVGGAIWVGMIVMTVYFLQPAVQETGPEGGKVMAALQRRGILTLIPILAVGTLVSGLWLYWRVSGGLQAGYVHSPLGAAYAVGGLAAIVAFAIGIVVSRPAMLKAVQLAQTLGPGAPDVARLRARAARSSRVVAVLLLLAVTAMAVARYL